MSIEQRRPFLPDHPSPLQRDEPLINTRVPPPPEEEVVDEFWKV